jgi:dTDP-4-amino-4,6-dideoxygalactose transaminase
MGIPIAKPMIGEEEKRAVLEVLSSGMLAQGAKVREFEEKFAEYIGTRYAIATSSGTTALHTALLSCGIGEGDEVITTPFSFIATANSILYCGARPVFADIDSRTFNIDPEEVKEKISDKTKAVLVVHLYGQPCEMDALLEICRDHGLLLIEDSCQAHGAEYEGKKAGSFGDCAVFSFYPTKNMTTGEGGMITTDSRGIAEKARMVRDHGSKTKYHHEVLGYNYRMTDIAAAIGIEQLKKLDKMNEKRIKNAEALTKGIKKMKEIAPPFVSPRVKHVFHQYTIRVIQEHSSRDSLARMLNEKGIATGIYYPVPIPYQKLYRQRGYEGKYPEADQASREVLSLPVHSGISGREIEFILSSLASYFSDI